MKLILARLLQINTQAYIWITYVDTEFTMTSDLLTLSVTKDQLNFKEIKTIGLPQLIETTDAYRLDFDFNEYRRVWDGQRLVVMVNLFKDDATVFALTDMTNAYQPIAQGKQLNMSYSTYVPDIDFDTILVVVAPFNKFLFDESIPVNYYGKDDLAKIDEAFQSCYAFSHITIGKGETSDASEDTI